MREVTRRSRDVFPLLLARGPGPGRVPLIYRRVFLHFLGTFLSLQIADLTSPIPTAPIFFLSWSILYGYTTRMLMLLLTKMVT
ncbi:hypothetical protein PanWU01x14_199620 [Parasponia andersonii]|uniref:Uncharacterized protein n=1 Tax=Parasponia andersonii TaxID=3476 RepID=A0A2P5BYD6_PARAD|nr:hypothetical protein PanWU01x14_199620 [Parasponia andersonii]